MKWQCCDSSSLLVMAAAVFLVHHPVSVVQASPSGASGCAGGMPAVGGPHLSSTSAAGSTLADGGLVFTIANPATATDVDYFDIRTGTAYTLLITGTLRGALIRVSTDTADSTFTLTPGVNGRDASDVCTDDNVMGVTHSENSDKTELAAELVVDAVGAVTIDVTVVVTVNPSVYYYESFIVTASEELPGGTEASTTIAPTVAPGTTETTTAPMDNDANNTTDDSASPTLSPVAAGNMTDEVDDDTDEANATSTTEDEPTDDPPPSSATPPVDAAPPTAPVRGPTVSPPTSGGDRTRATGVVAVAMMMTTTMWVVTALV